MEKKKGRFWLPLIISAGVYICIREINFAAKAYFFIMMFFLGNLMNIMFDIIAVLAVVAGIVISVYKTRNILIFPLAILITEIATYVFYIFTDAIQLVLDIASESDTENLTLEFFGFMFAKSFLLFAIALGVAAIAECVFRRKKENQ